MKHLLLFPITLLTVTLAFGQMKNDFATLKLHQESEKFDKLDKYEIKRVFGIGETGVYHLMQRNTFFKKYIDIVKYNNDLQPVAKAPFILKYKDNELELINSIFIDDELYFISSYEEDGTFHLVAHRMDKETLKTIEPRQFLSYEYNDDKSAKAINGSLTISSSSNKDKILIGHHPMVQSKNSEYSYQFWVFDADLNELWSADGNGGEFSGFRTLDYTLTKAGNVIVYGGKVLAANLLNYSIEYQFLGIFDKGKDVEVLDIAPRGIEPDGYSMVEQENGDITYGGFYGKAEGREKGCFLSTIDERRQRIKDREVIDFHSEFMFFGKDDKEDLIRKLRKERELNSSDGIGDYHTKEILQREDGNLVIVGEEINLNVYYHRGHRYEDKIYRDILLICVKPNGRVLWEKKIPKYQDGSQKGRTSFDVVSRGNELFVLYNEDDEDNLKISGEEEPGKTVFMKYLVTTHVDKDGNITSKILTEKGESDAILMPGESFQVNDDKYYFYGEKGNDRKFGFIKFN